ncbi:hypothetical protein CDAR_19841 [Caerostris darwini]|uniref:Uncharacterized protein n=1 Tax=Caerostris darwini TaxID=1538125 RepID=A0AAV4UMI9_9ARAC|nr:hypothetical protein CDAR_19841 [Caerostris darwini]
MNGHYKGEDPVDRVKVVKRKNHPPQSSPHLSSLTRSDIRRSVAPEIFRNHQGVREFLKKMWLQLRVRMCRIHSYLQFCVTKYLEDNSEYDLSSRCAYK